MSATPTRSIGLFKRAWNEIPEIVGSSFMGLIGLGLIGYSLKIYYDKDGDYRRHKLQYTVIRHDDPAIHKIRE